MVDFQRPPAGLRELALFAGTGGGILGGQLLGWRTVCAVENDRYAAAVLAQRQTDGLLHPFPIWDDVRTFRGHPWRGAVDVVSGGFPCQDISLAGSGKGLSGERSGLWTHMFRIVREVVPRFVFVENSPALTFRGLDQVLWDLASVGYDAAWGVLGAIDVGAPHRRDRIWILAHAHHDRWRFAVQPQSERRSEIAADAGSDGAVLTLADTDRHGGERRRSVASPKTERRPSGAAARCCAHVADSHSLRAAQPQGGDGQLRRWPEHGAPAQVPEWWSSEPCVGRVAYGVAHRVDRLRAIGNGQVPAVAAGAFTQLYAQLTKR